MHLNQGIEWAAHACAVLAPLAPRRGLSLAALAEFHGVPQPYMAKQMQALSKAGIVRTSRGRSGGYALARAPQAITLAEIAAALGARASLFRCTEIRQRGPCGAARSECTRPCGIAAAFARAEAAWRAELNTTTIATIVAELASGPPSPHLIAGAMWLRENAVEMPDEIAI